MSFFRHHNSNLKQFKLQAILRAKIFYKCASISHFLSNIHTGKRISSFSSLTCKAGMAVEASLAVPVFLFFIMNLLFSFEMLRLHGSLTGAMHQTGNKMAFYGYTYKSLKEGLALPEESGSFVMSEGYARAKVIEILGEEYLDRTCLVAGTTGLHFLKSSVMKGDDIIDLTVSYKAKPFIKIIGFPNVPMENRYYARAWTGYEVEGEGGNMQKEDPVVYIADTGRVYHTARNCTYLNPAIEAVSAMEIEALRNENGERYHACERCGNGGIQAVLYVTAQGNRYHGSVRCSGLKRTVYTIHLSETGGKGLCSKCAQNI